MRDGDHSTEDALVAAYVACKVALDAMPDLPAKVRDSAEPHVRAFCEAIEPVMREYRPELSV
jgi:hypothetical protein